MSSRHKLQDASGVIVHDPIFGPMHIVHTGAPGTTEGGKGAIYQRPDGAAGSRLYVNNGTLASASWAALLYDGMTVSALTVTTGTVTTLTSTTATITTLGSTTATITTANITTLVGVAWTASSAAATITDKANTAAAFTISDGTTSLYVQDTRSTVTVQTHLFDAPASQTLPNGATSRFRNFTINAHTVTLAGQTQVTTTNQGATLFLGGATYAQSGGAVTVDQVSTLHVAVAVAGSSVTITANRIISTGVSDAYLTVGGVWTDTACWADSKEAICKAADKVRGAVESVLDKLQPATWRYADEFKRAGFDNDGAPTMHTMRQDDKGRERVGIVYDDLPDELRAPGEDRGVSTGVLSSFGLAAIKLLWQENRELKARLDALEAA